MNTNTFALHSSPVGPKRFGGMDSCRSMPRRTLPPKRKMASAAANCKFHERPLLYLSTRLIAIVQRAFQKEEKIDEFESMLNELCGYQSAGQHLYRKQQELDVLCKKTSFSRQEIKLLYWGWKVACPEGILDERTFKDIYAQFFPQAGDASLYAHFVFNAMFSETLAKNNGQITFLDYACALSTLIRGTIGDKIKFIWTLYDINKDGKITYEEVLQISIAIYGLLGFNVAPAHNLRTYEEHAKRVFAKLDTAKVGYITYDQFKEICIKDETIFKSMESLDTSAML
ncbi:Kv channel interacting protein 2 [Tyrophagus putrescentiae]|nr:Kv channel interacting protein 2 [Tyrophagus putrescentiae]